MIMRTALILQIVSIIVLALGSYARNAVWQDDIQFWEDTAKKSPNRAGVHYNPGNVYLKEGRLS